MDKWRNDNTRMGLMALTALTTGAYGWWAMWATGYPEVGFLALVLVGMAVVAVGEATGPWRTRAMGLEQYAPVLVMFHGEWTPAYITGFGHGNVVRCTVDNGGIWTYELSFWRHEVTALEGGVA